MSVPPAHEEITSELICQELSIKATKKEKFNFLEKNTVLKHSVVKFFGLTELIKELGSTEDNDWVTLDLEGQKEIKMSLAALTRFKDSTIFDR